jgi:hypothetical protein
MIKTLHSSLFLSLLVATGCGESTDPKAESPGPSLLITNTLSAEKVYVTWNDAAGRLLFADSVGPRVSNRCIRLQPVTADSAQWTLKATVILDFSPLISTVTSYWFHPGDRRAAEVIVVSAAPQRGSPTIMAWDSASAVNGPVYGETREIPPHC